MRRLREFLALRALFPFPAGIVADKSADFSYFGLLNNANAYCGHLENITTAGTDTTLTAVQCRRRVLRLTSGASGGYTITLPSTKAIIAALNLSGQTIPTDGAYGQPFSILNDNVGQTGTLTAGDASTTITGTATVLTNTRRDWFLMVTGAGTLTYFNIGSAAI